MPKIFKPLNYRTNYFHLMGKDLTIAAMAGLHNHGARQEEVLNYLHRQGRDVLIGLHESENYTELTKKVGIDYHYIKAEDYTPIPPATFDAIYDIVAGADTKGKRVTLCCGDGNGRSGTTLAALKIREILERASHIDRAIFDHEAGLTEQIYASQEGDVLCTPIVKEAITNIRNNRAPENGNCGVESVETQRDIGSLIEYEKYLREKIKAELSEIKEKDEEQPAADPMATISSSTAKMSLLLAEDSSEAREGLGCPSGFDDELSSGYGTSTENLNRDQDADLPANEDTSEHQSIEAEETEKNIKFGSNS